MSQETLKIIEELKKQTEFEVNKEDFQIWLDSVVKQTDKYEYLEGITHTFLQKEIHDLLDTMNLDQETRAKYKSELRTFRLIDNICDFRINSFVRRMSREEPHVLKAVAMYRGLSFSKINTLVNIRYHNKPLHYGMNRFYTFQRMSPEECLIVTANDGCL